MAHESAVSDEAVIPGETTVSSEAAIGSEVTISGKSVVSSEGAGESADHRTSCSLQPGTATRE